MTEPSPPRPTSSEHVQYRGADLEPERGPGLGCFWIQVVVLVILLVLTPLSVSLGWPVAIPIALLVATLVLLFFVGQTLIFLLRIVAAERGEGRRRPRASRSLTVGELEDEAARRRPPATLAAEPAPPPATPDAKQPGDLPPDGAPPGGMAGEEPPPAAT